LQYRTATYAYGGYADIDRLFREQATELDKGKREAMLIGSSSYSTRRRCSRPSGSSSLCNGALFPLQVILF
jgi:hypothetical protein